MATHVNAADLDALRGRILPPDPERQNHGNKPPLNRTREFGFGTQPNRYATVTVAGRPEAEVEVESVILPSTIEPGRVDARRAAA